jgi:hypothetical protein
VYRYVTLHKAFNDSVNHYNISEGQLTYQKVGETSQSVVTVLKTVQHCCLSL